jgi:hypothetical protein
VGSKYNALAYHVTPKRNLKKIYNEGLLPKIGVRSKELGEKEPAVYCFPSKSDCETALGSWLGECFGEDCQLAILEVSIPDGASLGSSVGFEIACFSAIPPENILNYYNEKWTPYSVDRYKIDSKPAEPSLFGEEEDSKNNTRMMR